MVSKTVRESKGIFEYKGEWLDIGEPERRVYSEAMAFGRQLLSKAIEAADQKQSTGIKASTGIRDIVEQY